MLFTGVGLAGCVGAWLRGVSAVVVVAWATAAGAGSLDNDFLAAREAARVDDGERLERLLPRFKGHLLEPYVRYWHLKQNLNRGEIRAFLAQHRDTPLSDYLRRDWLKQLGKDGRWELFDAELPGLVNDDLELTCYALQARARTDTLALREARPLWFVARDLPDSCTPLFEALVASERLSTEDVWSRVRLALEGGQVSLANHVAAYLPNGEAPDRRRLSAISGNPAAYLAKLKSPARSRAARETAMFAVYRLARTAPAQAAAHWERLAPHFDDDERAYVWGMIGYFGAKRHDPAALDWFVQAEGMSDLQLGWMARAALRALRWPEVLAAIDEMTPKEAADPAWRYWKARALQALGREPEAMALFKPLALAFNFYGQLALEELGGTVQVPATVYRPTETEIQALAERPGIQRALALFRLDARLEGVREWLWAIRGFNDRQLLAAAELARRHAVYDRVISTAERTVFEHDFGMRYLAPYRDQLKAAARKLDLDEAWVNGLIRQESRFIARIKSSAGASGLMQLMPATARWVAHKLGLRGWRWSQVTEVDTNISLGTYYLRHVFDALDGSPVLASAAYNAGPNRARRWRADEAMEAAIYAESIPFNETRKYVKKVMSNATYYAHNFRQQAPSLKARIGVIDPRARDGEPSLENTP